jgi:hypothetical protein
MLNELNELNKGPSCIIFTIKAINIYTPQLALIHGFERKIFQKIDILYWFIVS